jgi:hypothetical protein
MHCFTVTDKGIIPGIRLRSDPARGVYVPIGNHSRFPVSPQLHEHFCTTMQELKELAEHNPLAQELVDEGSLLCDHANIEVTQDGALLTTDNGRRPPLRALVLVAAGDSPMGLFARNYNERVDPLQRPTPRVMQEYETFPPVGIDIVADTDEGKLLLLLPNAGFGLARGGNQQRPDYIVSWYGHELVARGGGYEEAVRTAHPARRVHKRKSQRSRKRWQKRTEQDSSESSSLLESKN